MELSVDYRGHGRPVLCLHGHPGTGRCMSVFTEYLAQNFQTIAPDLRGYGHSRTSHPFTMEQHLDDLSVLLAQLEQPCLILGWSLGGILAMELALKYPQAVAGLILVGTAAKPVGCHPPISWQDNVLTGIAGLVNWLIPGWSINRELLGRRSLFRYLVSQHSVKAYTYIAQQGTPAFLQTSPLAHRALNAALRQGYNRLSELPNIQRPCLMLAAQNDVHITPEASHETALTLPNCEWHLYENVAHLMPWEIGPELCHDIGVWLQTHGFLD